MPLFEYECQQCHHHFELLVREHTVLACPSCDGDDLLKQLSVFAVGSDGGGSTRQLAPAAGGGCGSCGDPRGPGACSMN